MARAILKCVCVAVWIPAAQLPRPRNLLVYGLVFSLIEAAESAAKKKTKGGSREVRKRGERGGVRRRVCVASRNNGEGASESFFSDL